MVEIRRVLHIVHGFPPESSGGTEAYVGSLLATQPDQGLDPSLLHGSFEPRLAPELVTRSDLGVPAWRLHRADPYSDYWDKAHYPPAEPLIAEVLDEVRPDIVHVHQWIRLTDDLVRMCDARAIPCVVSVHDVYSSCPACFRLRPDDSHCERELSFANCHDCVPGRGSETREEIDLGIRVYRDNFRAELGAARKVLAATRATAALVTGGLGRTILIPQLTNGFVWVRQSVQEGPSGSQTGTGGTGSAITWGKLTGWTITGGGYCHSVPSYICDYAVAEDLATVATDFLSNNYDIGTWTFHGTGFTDNGYIYSTLSQATRNEVDFLRGAARNDGTVPALPLLGIGAVGVSVFAMGVTSIRRRKHASK